MRHFTFLILFSLIVLCFVFFLLSRSAKTSPEKVTIQRGNFKKRALKLNVIYPKILPTTQIHLKFMQRPSEKTPTLKLKLKALIRLIQRGQDEDFMEQVQKLIKQNPHQTAYRALIADYYYRPLRLFSFGKDASRNS